jgi:hypothetical protein
MDAQPTGVFVVTLQGVEAPGPQPLTVLAFVAAQTAEAAEAVGADEVAALGWTDVAVLRSGEVTDEAALPADFAGAMETARRFGCGLIIYDEA